jgi:hypothetical protein
MNLSPLGDTGTEELLMFWLPTLLLYMLLLLRTSDLAELIITYALEGKKERERKFECNSTKQRNESTIK